ncbi:MAG TPA: NAD(P)/FAD-dependent oxidoreductase, partial [Planctomycetota bacterium]|nr:NAD(P)/FAD-dependent oxidoreductase [Planctomycetota bacterium]
RYRDRGALATIGRSRAVAEIGRFRSTGRFAWLLWVVVHVTFLIGFRNRFAVLFEWAWAYLTGQRSARIIPEPPVGAPDRP